MKNYKIIALSGLAVLAAAMVSCKSSKAVSDKNDKDMGVTADRVPQQIKPAAVPSPKAIVYRTKADYSNNVPVMMNAERTAIVSYPAPSDVRNNPVPTVLRDGWLLDNRGIGANVAYTSYTYAEYAGLESTPSVETLMSRIIDKDPLVEAWQCEPRHTYSGNEREMLDKVIESGFANCKRLK